MPTAGGNDLDGHMQAVDLDEQDTHSQLPLLGAYHKQPVTASPKLPLLFRDWWLWEIVSAGTASLAIVVIIIIFALFDQSSLPDWPSVFTVRSTYLLRNNLLLMSCIDKLSHLPVRNCSETFNHVGCWSFDIAIEMVMVPPGRASPSWRPSTL